MSIPSHTPYWSLYEHLPQLKTHKNMKMSKVQSERVFKCDHLGQSTTVTFILLPFLEGTVLSRIYGPNWVWHCSTALLNPRPVYSCGWRCSKLHQLQSYTITIPYCPWHLGYGKRTTGQTDRNTGSWHQVRWASMHSRGSVFPRLRRIKGSVQFLESLLFLMCSHQVFIDSQHVP
jgi:hypothetical protein